MALNSHWWLVLPVILSISDHLGNTACLGFYHPGFFFNVTVFEEQLLLNDGFSMLTSGIEFILLGSSKFKPNISVSAFMRLVLLSVGIFIVFRRRCLLVFDYVLSITFLLTLSFLLIKVLLFAELEDQLKFPGIWMSSLITFAFATVHFLTWFCYIKKRKVKESDAGYTQMTTADEDSSTTSVDSAAQSEKKPKIDRATAMEHIGRIMKYTAAHGWWFFGGFVFLVVYSGAKIFIPYYTGQIIAEIVEAKGKKENDFIRIILTLVGLTALR